ncbi:MAG: DUF4855 domain-containing protein [Dysgonamonadaceae bacterium]|jgi:hypothetical protein|nr:DUF4855 domain-containing protein [Dysgonamonadaceae bacterium]
MKKNISILIFSFLFLGLTGCRGKKETVMYSWEKQRTEILGSTDMVLIYGGGHQRSPYYWETDRLSAYVTYTDRNQQTHYLFDSFLFLEFRDGGTGGTNNIFATGYGTSSATKTDWENLINYYFQAEKQVGALDKCIGEAIAVLGKPNFKHQVVISMPEPIRYQDPRDTLSTSVYWGEIDGVVLDFLVAEDRIKACKWFINRVRAKFAEMNYQHVELTGFYWLAEESNHTYTILPVVATYLNDMKYSFNWIPYYNAPGFREWRAHGFNFAYLQPNHFFNEAVPYSRLIDACEKAIAYDMDMEVEFDERVLAGEGKTDRLRDYMRAFKEMGIWENKRLAYYQGNDALWRLKNSANEEDQDLYHEFCDFVISRPLRKIQVTY